MTPFLPIVLVKTADPVGFAVVFVALLALRERPWWLAMVVAIISSAIVVEIFLIVTQMTRSGMSHVGMPSFWGQGISYALVASLFQTLLVRGIFIFINFQRKRSSESSSLKIKRPSRAPTKRNKKTFR